MSHPTKHSTNYRLLISIKAPSKLKKKARMSHQHKMGKYT